MIQPYKRINCEHYDLLEIAAMRQRELIVRYLNEKRVALEFKDRLVDLQTKEKIEYAVFKSGVRIRLDWILQFGDVHMSTDNNCKL